MACDAASAAKERRHDAVITTVVSAHAAPRTTDALGPNAPDASAMAASDGTREYVNTGKSRAYTSLVDMPGAPPSVVVSHSTRNGSDGLKLCRRTNATSSRSWRPDEGCVSAAREARQPPPIGPCLSPSSSSSRERPEPDASCVSCVGAAGRMPPLHPPDPRPELCEGRER